MGTLMPGMNGNYAAAIDWGGTKLLVGLLRSDGSVAVSRQEPTANTSAEAILLQAKELLNKCLDESGIDKNALIGIGVSVPGVADEATGTLIFAPATGWRNVPVRGSLSSWLPLPVQVANDVDNCMRAETRFGAASDKGVHLWITVSTGIGGCILHDGKVFRGSGAAGEFGHIVVEEHGPLCGCGNRGCLEAVAAGPAILKKAQAIGLPVDSAKALAELATAGDAKAKSIFREASEALGRAIGATLNMIDPATVVIGGGLSPALDLDIVRSAALARSIRVHSEPPKFQLTALGSFASLIGAAELAFAKA